MPRVLSAPRARQEVTRGSKSGRTCEFRRVPFFQLKKASAPRRQKVGQSQRSGGRAAIKLSADCVKTRHGENRRYKYDGGAFDSGATVSFDIWAISVVIRAKHDCCFYQQSKNFILPLPNRLNLQYGAIGKKCQVISAIIIIRN